MTCSRRRSWYAVDSPPVVLWQSSTSGSTGTGPPPGVKMTFCFCCTQPRGGYNRKGSPQLKSQSESPWTNSWGLCHQKSTKWSTCSHPAPPKRWLRHWSVPWPHLRSASSRSEDSSSLVPTGITQSGIWAAYASTFRERLDKVTLRSIHTHVGPGPGDSKVVQGRTQLLTKLKLN